MPEKEFLEEEYIRQKKNSEVIRTFEHQKSSLKS